MAKYNKQVKGKFFRVFLILFFVNLIFFYPVWLKGQTPFPGDLLLAEYGPWKSYSYFGYSPGAIPNKAQSFDTIRQLYPWRFLAIESFKQGHWPLWNPYNFSGSPLLANFQTAAFYPLNIIYWFFSFNLGWTFQVMIQPFLASIFFYLFARRIKIGEWGSLVGAIAFGYGSFMTVWLEYNTIGQTILWLPLILLAIELLVESFSFFRVSLLLFALSFSFLAGHPQDFGTLWIFRQFYLLTRIYFAGGQRNTGKWVKILLVSILPFLVGAIQFLPGLELILNSARSPLTKDFLLKEVLLRPWELIVAFIPDFFGNPATRNYFLTGTYIGKVLYIGMLPIMLSFMAFLGKKTFYSLYFLISIIICLALTLSSPLSGFLYSLPLFSTLSPTRFIFVLQFSLAVLAAIGLDCLICCAKATKKITIFLVLIGLVFSVSFIFVTKIVGSTNQGFNAHLEVAKRNWIFSAILFTGAAGWVLFFLGKRKSLFWRRLLLSIMIIFLILDLFRFFHKITPFSPFKYIFPQAEVLTFLKAKGIDRYWSYGAADIESNYNGIFSFYSVEGYDPLYPRWYGEFIRSSEDGKIKKAVRSDAVIAHGFGRTDFPQNLYRQKVLQALNVRYILDKEENQTDQTTFDPSVYPLIWQSQGWRIYENLEAAPRAFLASKVYFDSNGTNFEKYFFNLEFLPQEQAVISQELVKKESLSSGQVKIDNYQPNSVELSVVAPEKQLLVLTDTYYPGWEALIDGKKTPIVKANYAFRAIAVPEGNHKVEFRYLPFIFIVGKIITIASLLVWLLAGFFIIMSKRLHKRQGKA